MRSRNFAEHSAGDPTSSTLGMACCRKALRRMSQRSPACSPNRLPRDMARTAVVLMNLGGPDTLEAVQPFLVNLFSGPAIIRLPSFLRLPVAWCISCVRARVGRRGYAGLAVGLALD